MIVLAILATLGAIGSLVVKKFALGLLLTSLAVVSIWPNHITTGEWCVFVVLFLGGLVPASVEAAGTHRKPIATGLFVLVTSVLLATPLNVFGGWGWLGFMAYILAIFVLGALFTGKNKVGAGFATLAIVAIIAAGASLPNIIAGIGTSAQAVVATATPTQTTPSGTRATDPASVVTVTATVTQAAMATCPAEFVQAPYDRGEFNRLVEGGAAALLPQGSAAPALDKRSAYLRAAGIDVNILAIYAHASGLWTDPNLTQGLVTDDKSCLTPTGQTLHAQLVGAWTAMGSKAENSPTPTTGTNSGIHNGVFVVAKEPGMRAGRTGVRITFSNGTSIFIDDLCLNPVYETPPPKSIIPGPTDEDECPDQPGRQAPGAACSKVGQIGSIDAGAHDPQGGKPDWTRNPLTTVEPSRPTVTNRATASPKPTKSATAPASTERPSSSPTTVVDEEPSHTSVPSPTSHW